MIRNLALTAVLATAISIRLTLCSANRLRLLLLAWI